MSLDKPLHVSWLVDTGEILTTSEGRRVRVLELQHNDDSTVLSAWAKHFRNHYCLDEEIEYLIKGTPYSKSEYLNIIKFPDQSKSPGPSVRSGDFGEILVADYLEFSLNYWVPRTRYGDKTTRNESTRGCDTLGFKFFEEGKESPEDCLAIFESKSQFSGNKANPRLQDAVNGSAIDHIRKAESLNAIKQRLHAANKLDEIPKVERFQNPVDHPYKELSGAVALFSTQLFSKEVIEKTVTSTHPNNSSLILLIIRGLNMMKFVHDLYRRAANEA